MISLWGQLDGSFFRKGTASTSQLTAASTEHESSARRREEGPGVSGTDQFDILLILLPRGRGRKAVDKVAIGAFSPEDRVVTWTNNGVLSTA